MHVTKETTGFVLIYIIVCNNESIELTVYGSSDINHCGVGDYWCNVIQGQKKDFEITVNEWQNHPDLEQKRSLHSNFLSIRFFFFWVSSAASSETAY